MSSIAGDDIDAGSGTELDEPHKIGAEVLWQVIGVVVLKRRDGIATLGGAVSVEPLVERLVVTLDAEVVGKPNALPQHVVGKSNSSPPSRGAGLLPASATTAGCSAAIASRPRSTAARRTSVRVTVMRAGPYGAPGITR